VGVAEDQVPQGLLQDQTEAPEVEVMENQRYRPEGLEIRHLQIHLKEIMEVVEMQMMAAEEEVPEE
jgi:hypothetical protein